jgi:glyoxylase I family protein
LRKVALVAAFCFAAGAAYGQAPASCTAVNGASPCFAPDRAGITTYPAPADASQLLRLHHITLFSPNHERLAEWYRDMLGFEIRSRITARRADGVEIAIIRVAMGGVWLNISRVISRVPNLTERDRRLEYTGWRHLAFATGDVQRAWESLRLRGAEVIGQGRTIFDPPGFATAFVRDPDGNYIELYQDL